MTNAIAASDKLTTAQKFLDSRIEKLRLEHSERLGAYLDPEFRPLLRQPVEFSEALKAAFLPGQHVGALLPWGKTHDKIAFRKNEVTVWAGANGSGKSLILGQCALDWRSQGERTLLASFEMSPIRTLQRMCRQAQGGRFPSEAFIDSFLAWLSEDRLFWFVDRRGVTNVQKVLAEIRYAIEEEGCTQIIVDNMGQLVRGEDDYSAQKDLIVALGQIAQSSPCHIHLVHHIRKLADVNEMPDKYAIRGSSAITDYVDNVILVHKCAATVEARKAGDAVDESKHDGLLRVVKQRNGEWEGIFGLWHDEESMAFRMTPDKSWRRRYDISC